MSFVRMWLCYTLLAILLVGCDQNNENNSVEQLSGEQSSVEPISGEPNVSEPNVSEPPPSVGAANAPVPFKERRVAIVYSQTSAKQYFDEFAYGQLFTVMQHQAMQAGIPYDLIKEVDLTSSTILSKYDVLIIPVMSHVDRAVRGDIVNTLLNAQENGLAIVTSSEFMTYDQDNQAYPNAYSAMVDVLGLTPKTYQVGVGALLKVTRSDHPITALYNVNELIDEYQQTWFADYTPINPSQATTLVESKIGAQSHAILQVLERPSRVVHFANDEFIADSNLLWSAIRWALYNDTAKVSLSPSRAPSLFIARNDMDQAMIPSALKDNTVPLLEIVKDFKRDYNFVGSFYIDIGNNPLQGFYTDWGVSAPLYQDYLALGNEFGTHSWTHPHDTSSLTGAELEYEFNQSRLEINTQLGIEVVGGAVPGNPENLSVVENLNQWFNYFSGRSLPGATGYRSGFGFLHPDHDMRYFNLNMTPDFQLIDYLNYSPNEAKLIWKSEIDDIVANAAMPVMHWLWHDYGPTAEAQAGRYSKDMFENTLKIAHQSGAEFTTLADYHSRLNALEAANFYTGMNETITARVKGAGLGQFSLKLDEGQGIASVDNWFAYNKRAVYIPDSGGEFSINLGAQQDKVTRIVELPMRARLFSVDGDADELFFSFSGQGEVVVELSEAMENNYGVTGADSFTIVDDQLVLKFLETGNHVVSITAVNALAQ